MNKGRKPKKLHRPAARPSQPPRAPAAPRLAMRQGMVYLFGLHAVSAAFLNPQRTCHALYVSEGGRKQMERALRDAAAQGLRRPPPQPVEPHQLDKLLGGGAVHQGIVLEAEPLPERALDDIIAQDQAPALLVMLDQVTDPHNVGAILRSACALGAGAVLMTDRHAAAATGTLAKAASGALEYIPLVRVPNLAQALAKLQKAGYWCIGLDESGARALHEITPAPRNVIVLGAEGEGLRRLTRESCDEIARLPTRPPIGSLNVSNAAAIALYEISRQGK